jgi:hypothetical protein
MELNPKRDTHKYVSKEYAFATEFIHKPIPETYQMFMTRYKLCGHTIEASIAPLLSQWDGGPALWSYPSLDTLVRIDYL